MTIIHPHSLFHIPRERRWKGIRRQLAIFYIKVAVGRFRSRMACERLLGGWKRRHYWHPRMEPKFFRRRQQRRMANEMKRWAFAHQKREP